MDEVIQRRNDTARAYQKTFLGDDQRPLPLAQLILEDLAVYCGETSDGRRLGGDGRVDEAAIT